MKRMKKIMALMLAAIMMMAMSVTTFAAETTTGKLTVNVKSGQTLTGQTIYLYKLFDVTESGSGATKNYAYTINTVNGYKEAIKSALGSSTITDTSTDADYADEVAKLGENDSSAVQKFANAFTTYALTNNVTETVNSEKLTDTNKDSYVFSNLAYGYYLVYVTGGKQIQSSLVTVDSDVATVNLKSEAPSIEKKANKTTVEIGNVVTYTVTGSIPDTTGYAQYTYKINDTLSDGLDFVKDVNGTALAEGATTVNVVVTFKDAGVTGASTAPKEATLDKVNHRKMTLDLSSWVRENQENNKGKEFTVTYYAKVNDKAVVTEKNSATLEYGNDPENTTETTPSEAKTPTYPLNIKKTDHKTFKLLAGAKFSLYTETEYNKDADTRQAIKVTGTNGNYVVDPTSENTVFESAATKIGENEYNLRVNGLAEGTYYLVETQAPDGYNKLAKDVKIVITKSTTGDETAWTLSKDDNDEADKIIDIENSTGSLLPSTGGKGAIAFGIIAAILVFGVVVSFIRDKRKAA